MSNFVVVGIAIFLGIATLDMPYGYYTFLRFVVTGVFGLAAFAAYVKEEKIAPLVLGGIAVLFNPFIPIYLTREIWLPIDIGAATTILVYHFFITKEEKEVSPPR